MLEPDKQKEAASRSELSRRNLLKGISCGVGGTALSSLFGRPVQAQSSHFAVNTTSTPLLLDGSLTGQRISAVGEASYGEGTIFVRTQSADGQSTDVQFIDIHSLNTRFSFADKFDLVPSSNPFKLPVADDYFVYTSQGSTVYSVKPDGSFAFKWPALSSPIASEFLLTAGLTILSRDYLCGVLLCLPAAAALSLPAPEIHCLFPLQATCWPTT